MLIRDSLFRTPWRRFVPSGSRRCTSSTLRYYTRFRGGIYGAAQHQNCRSALQHGKFHLRPEFVLSEPVRTTELRETRPSPCAAALSADAGRPGAAVFPKMSAQNESDLHKAPTLRRERRCFSSFNFTCSINENGICGAAHQWNLHNFETKNAPTSRGPPAAHSQRRRPPPHPGEQGEFFPAAPRWRGA